MISLPEKAERDCSLEQRQVIGVDDVSNSLHGYLRRWDELEDPKGLLGPGVLVRHQIGGEAAVLLSRWASANLSWSRLSSASARLRSVKSSTMVKNAKPKIHEGAPHGLCTTHKEKVNADLRS